MLLVLKVEVLVDNIELNCWKKRKEKERLRSSASDCGFLTREKAGSFPILIRRDKQVWSDGSDMLSSGKVPRHAPFHFLVGFFKDLGVRRIILKCDNEPSTKALARCG